MRKVQLHTNSASCQTGCHCEMRGDDVELSLLTASMVMLRRARLLRDRKGRHVNAKCFFRSHHEVSSWQYLIAKKVIV